MNKVSYFYRSLLWPLLMFFVLLMVALIVYSLVEDYKQQAEQRYQKQVAEVDTLYTEISEIKNKIDLINAYFDRFQLIKTSGYLDNQSRVNWIDRLVELTNAYGVRGVSFSFSSRDTLDSAQYARLAPFSEVLQREYLEIEGEFQHEGDVIHFMSDVVQKVNPLSFVESCSINSLNQKNQFGLTNSHYGFQADRGNMAIKCKFNFLALNVPKAISNSEPQP